MKASNLIGVAVLSGVLLIGCGGNRHAVTAAPECLCWEYIFDGEDYRRGLGVGESADLRTARQLALSSAHRALRSKFFSVSDCTALILDSLLLNAEIVCEEYELHESLYWCEIVVQIPLEAFRQTPDSLQTEAQEAQEWSEANRQKLEEYFKASGLDTIQIKSINYEPARPSRRHKTIKQ